MFLAKYRGGTGCAIARKRYSDRAVCGSERCHEMKYADGQEVKLGDVVALGTDQRGIVVCSIDTGDYSEAYPKTEWSYLSSGVLIEFPSYGLIHYQKPDPDLRLIAHASAS